MPCGLSFLRKTVAAKAGCGRPGIGQGGDMAKRKSTAQRSVYAALLGPLRKFSPADKNRVLRANGEGKKSPKQVI